VNATNEMPGHLARRFQQIAVAVFLAEVDAAGYDLTPVQYVALAVVDANPGIDQVTLAGLIAYDRTTITGVVDRLVAKGLITRQESSRVSGSPLTDFQGCGTANAKRQHTGGRGRSAHHAARPVEQRSKRVCAPATEGHYCRQRTQPGAAAERGGGLIASGVDSYRRCNLVKKSRRRVSYCAGPSRHVFGGTPRIRRRS
jgi:hypothetical protein